MIITVVCDVLGKANNGSTIAANNLIGYLKEQGHTVRVLCADQDKKGREGYFVVPNMNFLCFNKYVRANGITLAKPNKKIIRAALDGVDIVHVMFPFALGIASAKMAKKMRLPVSAGFHMLAENFTTHLHMEHVELASKITYAHFHKLYKNCDAIHYPTRYLRTVYERLYGETNGYVISNGINDIFTPQSVPEEDEFIRILCIGRYSKEKAQGVLIDAAKHSKYKNKIQLILAGVGPLKEELERQAAGLPVPPLFRLYSHEEIVNVINSAYLYVHPAEVEAEGISCMEAMACGIVPVISNAEKCATRGYALTPNSLFQSGKSRDLAAKIDWWIDHPDEREAYGQVYYSFSKKNFDQTTCMAEMERMLFETVEKFSAK